MMRGYWRVNFVELGCMMAVCLAWAFVKESAFCVGFLISATFFISARIEKMRFTDGYRVMNERLVANGHDPKDIMPAEEKVRQVERCHIRGH